MITNVSIIYDLIQEVVFSERTSDNAQGLFLTSFWSLFGLFFVSFWSLFGLFFKSLFGCVPAFAIFSFSIKKEYRSFVSNLF